MRITFEQNPTLLDFLTVVANAPADQRQHFTDLTGFPFDPDGVAIGNFAVPGPKWVIRLHDGFPLAVGGFVPQRPGVFRDFFISTEEAFTKENYLAVTRICRRIMDSVLASGAHRLECFVPASRIANRPELEKWYRLLGYNKEALHHGYCANGADGLCYARVKH